MAGGLTGRRIVVPESRELDLFVAMLARQGAEAIRCPLVTILDLSDTAEIEDWLEQVAAHRFDDLVFLTGEGIRRLAVVAERTGGRDAMVAGLSRARRIVRGPKPIKALRELGLAAHIVAGVPTSEGLIETLRDIDLAGRQVGMQVYPGQDGTLDAFFAGRGAVLRRVLPYRYASHEEDALVAATIAEMERGIVDLIAFTSRPQVQRLLDVAERHGLRAALDCAMAKTRIAAVGPVVGQAVASAGWQVAIAPEDSFHLKPMIGAMIALFAGEAGTSPSVSMLPPSS